MQYFCKNQERSLKVGSGNLINGIDYMEVASHDQKTLEVHFLHPLPGETGQVPPVADKLEKDNLLIEGGTRIKNIEVVAIDANKKILTVHVNKTGDFSNYTLRLVLSPTDLEPPAGFDPQLSAVTFSFKANCPTGFDCKTENYCSEEKVTNPRIDYLAKDYTSFRRLIIDRLSKLMPDWKERNVGDLQIALVELMAYTGDYLSYYQDAVATEAYLFTARKRVSARRHSRLLDYHLHNGCNSRTWISIEVESGGNADLHTLPDGSVLLTKGRDNKVMVNSDDFNKLLEEKDIEVFETKHKLPLYFVHNEIEFYTWDNTDCCLSRGAKKATLYRKDQSELFLEVGQVILFEEIACPKTGREADADPRHRHMVRLTKVKKKVDILHDINVVEIEWHEADVLPFSLCISAKIEGLLHEKLSVARGNIVLADHGKTIKGQKLSQKSGPGSIDFLPVLPHKGITVSVPYNHLAGLKNPASGMLLQDPHEAIPEITLVENDELWLVKRDLLASDRFAREFVAEIESDQTVKLRFGDDILGKNPGEGFQPRATYRLGNGPTGNIGSEAIGRIVWDTSGILKVRNPMPAQGGKSAETIEEVKQYAPEAFRTQERAVTEDDYIAKIELYPEVQKALAKFRWTGSWYTVFLTIDRKNGLPLNDQFKDDIYAHLEKYRMAGYDLEIRPPVFVPLEIEMNVCVKSGYFRSDIRNKLLDVFSRFDLPDGSRGFFHPDEFTFGQPVYLSAIYQGAMNVDGIASVELKTFKRWGRTTNQEKKNGIFQPAESEIIRLDNDPNFPENGKITFLIFGGL